MNYEFIEKTAAERSPMLQDPLDQSSFELVKLNSLGVKWKLGDEWFGIWGEYVPRLREVAWQRMVSLVLAGDRSPMREGAIGGPEFVLE